MRKSTVVVLNQLNIKNNKIDKDNFEKHHNKKNHVGKHCSNPQCFKEKNYEATHPAQYEKKNRQRQFWKKNHKKMKKKPCGETL